MWCIPPEQSAEFVCAMENVLDTYKRPYSAKRPVVNMDETSKQLVSEKRMPQQGAPDRRARYDYEYKREGTANVFMFTEPLQNWRAAIVTKRRTAVDWAHQVRDILDGRYADAERVTLVMDNLNTHTPASFYEAFEPAEARRLAEKIDIVYTPKHGSWLNVAEIELGLLARQCMSQRIGSARVLKRHISAWTKTRNRSRGKVRWQFTTEKARVKLHRLYPQIQS
jgi:hypothetical protein